ncbi:hypothetical protein GGR26_002813 [Lewinella marina]|uniref:YdhG-like domain-containing protein n=1 Tax=Neolewinella marina TaxID=438751 RepID=A0A2G0CCT9_9BACT|nr:DUF1801 domain-containing protein [Neolewinella marina]NJB87036.1 hypothetical protein [Neolewinella marina]PHK97772.1 hypothetical protein CGL56_13220 [Neolewinella marina]
MAENKTTPTSASPGDFLDTVEDPQKRADAYAVMNLMAEVTGEPPCMWGDSIVGFGTYRYRYASGREGEWMVTGFSPRKQNLTLYVMSGLKREEELLQQLGPHKHGKSCLYLKRLADVDREVLRELIARSVAAVRRNEIRY